MNTRVCRASAIVVQTVPAAAVDGFLAWQGRVTETIQAFDGYTGTDVYPPGPNREEWVVVFHFTEDAQLQRWLDSPERSARLRELPAQMGEFQLNKLSDGFAAWFVDQKRPHAMPPAWKIVMTVVLGLFPTVMILQLTIGKLLEPLQLGVSVGMLIGNCLSVSILQWFAMPLLTRLAAPWLQANGPGTRNMTVMGTVVIVGLLMGLALGFRQLAG